MSRRNTFPSFSSSRQMMIAWKVSGLSHRPAIIASRPASMRLAIAISPSRDEQLDRAHLAQIHAHRIVGALARLGLLGLGDGLGRRRLDEIAAGIIIVVVVLGLLFLAGLFGLDDVDAHLVEHREHVLDLLRGDFLGGQNAVELLVGDIAALLGVLDHLPDGGIRKIEQRAIGGLAVLVAGVTAAARLAPLAAPALMATALIASTLLTGALPASRGFRGSRGLPRPWSGALRRRGFDRRGLGGAAFGGRGFFGRGALALLNLLPLISLPSSMP